MEYVILWAVMSAAAGYFAVSKGRNGAGWFLLSILISPLLSIILIAFLADLKKSAGEEELRQQEARRPKTRNCPFCAEQIMAEAIRCKHCGADIPVELVVEETTEEKIKRYGIYRDSGQYIYGPYRYTTIEEAIAYAEKQGGGV